jgi:hypothetical protein
MHDHQETSEEPETRVATTTQEVEATQIIRTHDFASQIVVQVENNELLITYTDISASNYTYTGLPIKRITSQHSLRAPPRIFFIKS